MTAIPDWTRALLDAPTYATLATLNSDGSPQLTEMWVARDEETVIFSSVAGRQKPKNIARDPRVSVLLVDPDSPFRYSEIRGTAEVVDDPGELIQDLAQKYTGKAWPADPPGAQRVIIRLTPTRVHEKKG
ncbi:PPOX class F420-dependent oxidoreductase [Naumannella halotolerans]|uniref:PPOX class probable F420-dependent enzyme n=1 Tax=Naumannella halotolerans TaxID=993414 RepID=A0A4R7J3J4_9ACTN|nr:PPOX class F420-dependent oxidoreductase [Naumannella halotolerans]TDT31076.1 PPOX class probable F420-dependent enzyme [Naumannella halotolerans]